MTHRERTKEITAASHAVLDARAGEGETYRDLARLLLQQMAWAQDKMERSERLCKDPWDRAHLRTVKQALVFNHPLLKKDREFIMELNPHVTLSAGDRKAIPLCTGVLDYFPDALIEVAKVSKVGNDQHNPGQPLHWAKEKSTDEVDALVRHLLDRGKTDADGTRHSAKIAWRALANLQREIDAERAATPRTATEVDAVVDRAEQERCSAWEIRSAAAQVDAIVDRAEQERAGGILAAPVIPMKDLGPETVVMSLERFLKLVTGGFTTDEIPTPTAPDGYTLVTDGAVKNGDIILRAGAGQKQWEPMRPLLVMRSADVAQGRMHGTFVARWSGVGPVPPPITFELPASRVEADYRPLEESDRIQFGDLIRMVDDRFQTASSLIGGPGTPRVLRPISVLEPTEELKVEEPAPDHGTVTVEASERTTCKPRRWRSAPKGHILTRADRIKINGRWESVCSLAGVEVDSHGRLDGYPVQVLA